MKTINDIVREVAAEMLNTSMQDITAERIHGWATRLGEVATCKDSLQVGNKSLTPNEMETINDIVREMREFADADSQTIGRDVLRRKIQHFADRIEVATKAYNKEITELLREVIAGVCLHCDMQSACQEGEDGMSTNCNAVAKAKHFIEQHTEPELNNNECPF